VPTVVCCVEAGRIEEQTLRMVRSLRTWGGRLRGARVLAAYARAGAPLARATLRAFADLGVERIAAARENPAWWYDCANKIAAITAAERVADTPTMLWLDGDVLIAGEPAGLLLAAGVDFAGRGEILTPAVSAPPANYFEPYWRAVTAASGLDFDAFPMLHMGEPDPDIRFYLNAGVLAWRRGVGFPEALRADFRRLLRSRLVPSTGESHTIEQVAVSLAVRRLGLAFRHLDRRDHHMSFPGLLSGPGASPSMARANLIHYSGSCGPGHWEVFLGRLRVERPELHDWLAPQGPIEHRLTPLQKALAVSLKAARSGRRRFHFRRTVRVPPATA